MKHLTILPKWSLWLPLVFSFPIVMMVVGIWGKHPFLSIGLYSIYITASVLLSVRVLLYRGPFMTKKGVDSYHIRLRDPSALKEPKNDK